MIQLWVLTRLNPAVGEAYVVRVLNATRGFPVWPFPPAAIRTMLPDVSVLQTFVEVVLPRTLTDLTLPAPSLATLW